MKRKLWIAGLLSCALVGLGAPPAQAFFWRNSCCNKYSTYICVRPYNAFSPVCFGSIYCDGCCPLQMCQPPTCNYHPCHPTPNFCPPGLMAPPLAATFPAPIHPHGPPFPGPAFPPYPYMISPTPPPPGYAPMPPAGPDFTPPPPTPVPTAMTPHGMSIQRTDYSCPPGVYPGFWPAYPIGYWTNAYAPPAYWHSGMPYGR